MLVAPDNGTMSHMDLVTHARDLLTANDYLTLGTADATGRPWTTPVCFRAADEREYFWLSATEAEHSRNIAVRPDVSLVVFDSTVPLYHGRAVYAAGAASIVPDEDLDRALSVYTGFERARVSGDSPYRLYRVAATEVWVLCPGDPGQPCELHGITRDHRTAM